MVFLKLNDMDYIFESLEDRFLKECIVGLISASFCSFEYSLFPHTVVASTLYGVVSFSLPGQSYLFFKTNINCDLMNRVFPTTWKDINKPFSLFWGCTAIVFIIVFIPLT